MKGESILFKSLLLVVIVLFIVSARASVNHAAMNATPQGKGGTIKPIPTPTPKKTVPPKKTTTSARANRAGASNPPARKAEPEAAKTSAAEIAFWETIKTSTNPEDFREYLKKYPNGEFAGLARIRLTALETAAKEDAARKEEAIRKEEAKRKEEEAAKKRPGALVKNSIGMELVYVPAGSFMMGSEKYLKDGPAHQVTIREGFYMGRYEVTQAQWQAVMGSNPSEFKGDNLPVEQVSWNDAQKFIQKLSAMNDGYIYRLPSEAEWEYACRAGATGDYAGNLDSMAWYANNSGRAFIDADAIFHTASSYETPMRENGDQPHPVGQKQPNGFGLYDMHGNVWEWCEDRYHENYNGAPTDGSAWESGGGQDRVIRGGSWYSRAEELRSSYRYRWDTDSFRSYFGFRVVAVARTQ